MGIVARAAVRTTITKNRRRIGEVYAEGVPIEAVRWACAATTGKRAVVVSFEGSILHKATGYPRYFYPVQIFCEREIDLYCSRHRTRQTRGWIHREEILYTGR